MSISLFDQSDYTFQPDLSLIAKCPVLLFHLFNSLSFTLLHIVDENCILFVPLQQKKKSIYINFEYQILTFKYLCKLI